jgi:predicted NodU family carbamoyl transferase
MKALLNAKIKRRESFRPFAPSVLEEAVADWFEENDAVPFMMQVFKILRKSDGLSLLSPTSRLMDVCGPGDRTMTFGRRL